MAAHRTIRKDELRPGYMIPFEVEGYEVPLANVEVTFYVATICAPAGGAR